MQGHGSQPSAASAEPDSFQEGRICAHPPQPRVC